MPAIEFAEPGCVFKKSLLPSGVIHWSEAKEHIDENVTIYGEIASTYFDWQKYDRERDRWVAFPDVEIKVPPTFIEVGAKYPNAELLKVVIWGRDRKRFEQPPEDLYRGKAALIKGRPYMYNGLVHIKVSSPAEMTVVEPIAGLYRGWGPVNADCRPVFVTTPVPEKDSHSEYYGEEYREREPDYYDWDTGGSVSRVGDYFYDADGNCVEGADVRERHDSYW